MSKDSVTLKNLEAAFTGESMASRRYVFFAKRCRELGADDVATLFETTAEQETLHALAHLDLIYPKDKLSVEDMLKIAIQGETHEFTDMYPTFARLAREEIAKAPEASLKEIIEKAAKRFAALAKVEEKHASHYGAALKARVG